MKVCLKCDKKHFAKGFCRNHYYQDKYRSTYRTKSLARSAERWKKKTPEQLADYKVKYRESVLKRRDRILKYVPNVCALEALSPCSHTKNDLLHRDHDHSCDCGKLKGCKKCFRGLLCNYHNAVVIPVFEAMNPDYVPEIVKNYLLNRPLKDADFEFTVTG